MERNTNNRPIPTNVFIKLKCREEVKCERAENEIFRSFTSWFSLRFVRTRFSCRVVCEMCEQSMSAPSSRWKLFRFRRRFRQMFPGISASVSKMLLRLREGEITRGSLVTLATKGWRTLSSGKICHKNLLIGECKNVETHKIKSTCQRFD